MRKAKAVVTALEDKLDEDPSCFDEVELEERSAAELLLPMARLDRDAAELELRIVDIGEGDPQSHKLREELREVNAEREKMKGDGEITKQENIK